MNTVWYCGRGGNFRHGHQPFSDNKHVAEHAVASLLEAAMDRRAIQRTFGAAALIGSLTAIGAVSRDASAATNPKISGLIWSDTNANNTREAGEPGASGKRVVLTSADEGRTFWASRTTGTSGWWGVVVPPGCYNIKYDFPDRLGTLKFDPVDPFDLDPSIGSPRPGAPGYVANTANNVTRSAYVCVNTTNETTYASIPPNEWHRLTLKTWLDKNRDGIRQSTEPGVANIKNTPGRWVLTSWQDNLAYNWATKTTDSSGSTTWWVPAGSCGTIGQGIPTSPVYGHTKSNVGSDATDSDFVNGTPGPIFCVGRTDVTIGSGLIDLSTQPQPDALTVTGRVWVDANRNGRQDTGEQNAPDGMVITNRILDRNTDCPATATAKTAGGRYTLVMSHTINCNAWLDYGIRNDSGDYTRPAGSVLLSKVAGTNWASTLSNVGSDTGDSDGYFHDFQPNFGCEWDDITCADIPATGAGPITIDFGIVKVQ